MSALPCCADQQLSPGAFADALLADPANRRAFPVAASLDLTSRCNLNCRHCFLRYNGGGSGDRPAAEVERTLDILRDFGVLFLVMTGGDPFCRPDFTRLYLAAKQHGFVLTLFSNGTLLDDPLMDFLAEHPPRRLELTAYGHTQATYEAVTGVPGSFRRFRQATDGLLGRGLLVRIKSMIMRTNVHELEAMRDWAAELGCDYRYDAIIHPCLNGDPSPLKERLHPEVIARFRHRDRDRQAPAGTGSAPPPARRRLFECGAGLLTVHVDAQLQAHPCLSWRHDPFDLSGQPTTEAWATHIRRLRDLPAPGGACDQCHDRARCQCCVAYSVLETGSRAGVPPFFCQLVQAEHEEALRPAVGRGMVPATIG